VTRIRLRFLDYWLLCHLHEKLNLSTRPSLKFQSVQLELTVLDFLFHIFSLVSVLVSSRAMLGFP
jgi:hypothetical protein